MDKLRRARGVLADGVRKALVSVPMECLGGSVHTVVELILAGDFDKLVVGMQKWRPNSKLGLQGVYDKRRSEALALMGQHAVDHEDEALVLALMNNGRVKRAGDFGAQTTYCLPAVRLLVNLKRELSPREVDVLYEIAFIEQLHDLNVQLRERGVAPSRKLQNQLQDLAHDMSTDTGRLILQGLEMSRPYWEAVRTREQLKAVGAAAAGRETNMIGHGL